MRTKHHPSFDEWNAAVKNAAETARVSPIAVISGVCKKRAIVIPRWRAWRTLHQAGYPFFGIAATSGFHHATIMNGLARLEEMEGAHAVE